MIKVPEGLICRLDYTKPIPPLPDAFIAWPGKDSSKPKPPILWLDTNGSEPKMSNLPDEFVELMAKKRKLELLIQNAIIEFEDEYHHVIEIESIRLERMRAIGPRQALSVVLIKTDMKVS